VSQVEATRLATTELAVDDRPGPRFVVTVGTDHHPFDRLIGWVNDWLAAHPGQAADFFVQSGAATVEPTAASVKFLDAAALSQALDEADVMICHGGPGAISDAWRRGQVPIAVPRLRKLGEVVDDHQVDFCRKLASTGKIRIAEDAASLHALIDEAVADRSGYRLDDLPAEAAAAVAKTVARFEELVNDLVKQDRPRRFRSALTSRRARRPHTAVNAGEEAE
jgi:UDP-N-acetylglucosamine transferase subunit ALG13